LVDKGLNIIRAVEAARRESPIIDDVIFSVLKDSKVGSPVMVFTPAGEPSFWIVPLLIGKLACGFATVKLSGKVIKMGIFGSSPRDRSSWIDESFFRQIPLETLKEIETKFSSFIISEPFFSYDSNQTKWAWMLKVGIKAKFEFIVFVTPGGWYERQLKNNFTESEG
jgi:hypothetical protein